MVVVVAIVVDGGVDADGESGSGGDDSGRYH